jgi:hypothetical protein
MLSISQNLSSVGPYRSGLTNLDKYKITPPIDFINAYNNSSWLYLFGRLTKDMQYYRLPKGGNIIVDK